MARRTISSTAIPVPSVLPVVEEEKTDRITVSDLVLKIGQLEDRVEELEARERVFLLTAAPPIVGGSRLERCKCGRFSTRKFRIVHQTVGTEIQAKCDHCSADSPIIKANPNSHFLKVEEMAAYQSSKATDFARRLNASLEKAYEEVAERGS